MLDRPVFERVQQFLQFDTQDTLLIPSVSFFDAEIENSSWTSTPRPAPASEIAKILHLTQVFILDQIFASSEQTICLIKTKWTPSAKRCNP